MLMILELDNINKSFTDKQVLSGISFKAESGKALGLLGRNGAGKTTTIRILMNVFPADDGSINIDSKTISYDDVQFGYLPEERGLYSKKKVIQQLTYFAELKGMSKKDAIDSVDYWLKRLGMEEYRNKKLETLSKGNQQKIQLITAVSHNPDIIILDEPFSGIDPVNAMLLKDVVKEQIAKGKIVLFSSHQMNYIEEFCDDIVIIHKGKIVLQGNLNLIKRSYPRNKLIIRSQNVGAILTHYKENCFENEDGSLLIQLKDEEDKNNEMKYIVNNFDIDEVKVFEPTLNDIFVEYTEDKTHEVLL